LHVDDDAHSAMSRPVDGGFEFGIDTTRMQRKTGDLESMRFSYPQSHHSQSPSDCGKATQ
jgi:hypothetical protein